MLTPAKPVIGRRDFLVAVGAAAAALTVRAALPSLGPTPPQDDETSLHEALFYEPLPDKAVRCALCPRRCSVPDGGRGYCRVRENQGGRYVTRVYGRPCAMNLDPIEKKPFFHVYPGSSAFSIATVGCNIHCKFCQNWDISQAKPEDIAVAYRSPKAIADAAVKAGARTLAFTYSEPTVFFEYMLDCAKAAAERGVAGIVVSNGFINDAPQRALFPHVKAIKIDLKAFTPSFYSETCDGMLQPVLDTLLRLAGSGVWFEIVCLLIPTLNDNVEDIQRMAGWIVNQLGPDVPVHFTRYQPLYRLRNLPPTPPETLLHAREIAMKEGCHFAYTGNVPGLEGQDTLCPSCGATVIARYGTRVLEQRMEGGKCRACGRAIPGIWA